tara:strand:- start:234 stop:428 length:195 start_codon:yes stop_codon:yes gene_type:complete
MKIGDLVKLMPHNIIGLIINKQWVCMDSSSYEMEYFELLCVDNDGFSGKVKAFSDELEVIFENR